MPVALLPILIAVPALAALLWLGWREHDRLILLAWRAERAPCGQRAAAVAAYNARISRPLVRPLARWMGLTALRPPGSRPA
jgi:hypothetical protein